MHFVYFVQYALLAMLGTLPGLIITGEVQQARYSLLSPLYVFLVHLGGRNVDFGIGKKR